jgi:ArsR family transcriptional regulator
MEALAIVCCAPRGTPLLSAEEADATAVLFRSLGDPARVRIMNVLATSNGPVCICNLVEPLGLSQPTVSHHMKKLLEVGLVDREQHGKWAYFTLKPEAARKLAAVADLKGVCC